MLRAFGPYHSTAARATYDERFTNEGVPNDDSLHDVARHDQPSTSLARSHEQHTGTDYPSKEGISLVRVVCDPKPGTEPSRNASDV